MVIEVMRERMRPGLVMGDHPSIAGRSRVLGRRNIFLKGTKGQARGATETPMRGQVGLSRVDWALRLTTRCERSNGMTRGVLESTAPTFTLYIGDST